MRVSESVGVVSLLVERAQGVIGEISVEWSTEDATAVSTGVTSPDYEVYISLLTKLAINSERSHLFSCAVLAMRLYITGSGFM